MDRFYLVLMVVSVAFGALLLVSSLGQWTSGYGGLQNQVDNVSKEVDNLGEEQADMRQEMRESFRELREEIRISKGDVIAAISEHEHEEETGMVVFRSPP